MPNEDVRHPRETSGTLPRFPTLMPGAVTLVDEACGSSLGVIRTRTENATAHTGPASPFQDALKSSTGQNCDEVSR